MPVQDPAHALRAFIHDPEVLWLFDYDLTLYPWSEAGVLHSLDERINRYIIDYFACSSQEANEIRQKYWSKHGTTLAGLMEHESVDPHHYFDFIHAGPGIQVPSANRDLARWLQSIQGRRFVFTNAREDWAQMGLKSMGIEDCFEGVFDLEFFNWLGKPSPEVYRSLSAELDLNQRKVLFFDDKLENLIPAREMGWLTVWIRGAQNGDESQAHWVLNELSELWNVC